MLRRYACVRQQDITDCGAACLATLALHHRMPVGVQRLRDLCGTDRAGSNLLGLLRAAERLGFDARAVKGEYEHLKEVTFPAIAHTVTREGLGHFVVLHGVKGDRVVVADPGAGIRRLSREEFCEQWTGYLLLLTPGTIQASSDERNTHLSPWRRFLALLRPQARVLAEAFVAALLMTGLGILTSYFVQHLVDSVLVHGETRLLNALAMGMVAVVVFKTAFGVVRQSLLIHVSRKVDLSLIADYSRHVLHLPLGFFETRRVGEILARVNDAVKIREAISGATLTAILDGTLVVITAVVMFLYDWRLAALACAFSPILLASVVAHHPGTRRRSREAMEEAARLQANLVENVSAVDTIKTSRLERDRADRSDDSLVDLVQSLFSLQKLGLSMTTAGAFVTGLAGIVILWVGGHRVVDGALTIGQLMFFYTLLGNLLGPLERLASINMQFQDALIAVDRLGQVLELDTETDAATGQATFPDLLEGLALESVTFRYGSRDDVLRDVDMTFPAGRTIAIVGESGSGKTTLLKLLMRLYEPTSGRFLADGIDARDITIDSLRRSIGYVSQDPFIFNGTVRENIALEDRAATLEQVAAAARAAGLESFVNGLPERFDTVIGERGANLSGGQKQRLAIARVLLAKPPVVIFDEATSHLDTATERAIQENLRTELVGRTVILVAHRLSTIRDADLIYVLQDGRVVERGTHASLASGSGLYSVLWAAQSGGARVPEPPTPSEPAPVGSNGRARVAARRAGSVATTTPPPERNGGDLR